MNRIAEISGIIVLLCAGIMTAQAVPPRPKSLTPFRPPDAAQCVKQLENAKKLASNHPSSEVVCIRRSLAIAINTDRSGETAFTEEYYLNRNSKTPLRETLKHCFIQIILPDGSYREYRSPARIPLIAGSLVSVKYTESFPASDPVDFLLEFPLDLPVPTLRTEISLAKVKFERFSHAVVPPAGKKSPVIVKRGRHTYSVAEIKPFKGGGKEAAPRLRFMVGALPDWAKFAEQLRSKKFAGLHALPEERLFAEKIGKSKLTMPEKLERLHSRVRKTAGGRNAAALLVLLCGHAGIAAQPAAIRPGAVLNTAVPVNRFTHDLVFVPEQNGCRNAFWLDPSAPDAAKLPPVFAGGTALVLKPGGFEFKTVP